mmetsp:Transcript_4764/g.18004  ORF Transcript_4764/g.18004 Transcript_4764/m.18004 type:complete len:216 (-) Transcript_4764:1051-1698(-)
MPLQPRGKVLYLFHGLTDGEVRHDLLAATQDCLELEAPLKLLHDIAHAGARDGPPPKDLARVVADDGGYPCLLVLQQGNRPGKMLVDVRRSHVVHLEREILQHAVHRLDLRGHLRQLVADDRLLDQRLPENLSQGRPTQALFEDHSRVAVAAADHAPALEVEIRHRLHEAHADLPDQVLLRYVRIVDGHIRGASSGGVGGLDRLCGDRALVIVTL